LLLTEQECDAGIKRGKAYKRREQFQRRLAHIQAKRNTAKPAEPGAYRTIHTTPAAEPATG
jgi:hypothetical protein